MSLFNKKKTPQAGPSFTDAEQRELQLGQHNALEALNYLATLNRHGVDKELKQVFDVVNKVVQGKATLQDFRAAKRSMGFTRAVGAAESFVLAVKRMQMKAN